jgi:hypothetical protein
MKTIHGLLGMFIAAAHVTAAEPGLYNLKDESHPRPFLDAVGRVTITSQSNDNTQYSLALHAASSFSLPCTQIGLIIGEKTIRFHSQGHNGAGGYSSMETWIEGRELAKQVAELFRVAVIERRHPGHQLLVQFIPEKKEFKPGEAANVKFRITNMGRSGFTFIAGGRQRRATRNNQFAFSAQESSGAVLPDTGNGHHNGGLGFGVTVEPGKAYEASVDLSRWFTFTRPGSYQVRGSYYMEFVNPAPDGFNILWEDFACAEFTVEISN